MKIVNPDILQKEIEALPPEAFEEFVYGENMAADRSGMPAAECEEWYSRYPILRRYDDAFRAAVREMRETEVRGAPAIWLIYNMGVIVKTRASLFSIDLCHRLAPTIADELDFAVITHNHLDHYTREFYRAMDSRHKTVFQNFECNYGAALNIVDGKLAGTLGGYTHGEAEYQVGDVAIRTFVSDHNTVLRQFVMPVEVRVGDFTILHSGDTDDVENLRPSRRPDLWIHHAWCWGGFYNREEWVKSQTVRGIKTFNPRCAVVAHFQELSHAPEARVGFDRAGERVTAAEEAGARAIAPFWGERIV